MNDEIDQALFPDSAALQEAESVWNQGAEAASKDNPIGRFQALVEKALLGRSQSSGRLQIAYTLIIQGGQHDGVKIYKYDGLSTAQQAKITQDQLKRLGVDTKSLTLQTLPAALLSLENNLVQIETKKNGDYYNVYFQKRITAPAGSDNSAAAQF